jgi:hypothetical protein
MNTRIIKKLSVFAMAAVLGFTSCVNDLNTLPLDKDVVTSEDVYAKAENYKGVLAKLYAGLAVTGQQGPDGMADISGLDEGFGQYLRGYWYAQQLPTDEAVLGWNDGNLRDYHDMDWTSNNEFISAMYSRIFYQISLCNEFIRESSPEKLAERGISDATGSEIALYREEARFLRALSYYHALDLFGNIPFVTEEDKVGAFFPEQISRADLFTYVESELLAIENNLSNPGQAEYGRADKGAAWALLAKLYLNAEVYTGQKKYTESLNYSKKVIAAGYSLENNYQHLFLADNHKSKENIFTITQDGLRTKTWGGTTFIIHAAVGGSMKPADFGIDGGWGGLRTTKQFVSKFMNIDGLKSAPVKTKSTKAYPVIYVPGGYQKAAGYSDGDWSPADAPQLASVNSDNNYEGYIYFSKEGDEYKFTAGPNWDVNWGDNDADGTLEPNGANIKAPAAGLYKINVNLNDFLVSSVKTEWGVIGDATPTGWDSDTNMDFDPVSKEWTIIVELGKGSFKFRANDGWDINLGDNGANGTLEYGGDNIAIAEAGKYEIKLKLGTPDYTYTVDKFSSDGRSMFYTEGQSLEIEQLFEFTYGYGITKWKNVTSTGQNGSDLTHCDTDFPVFRLADIYLMYAEAVLRGGSGGDASTALNYVNQIRTRAYGDNGGNITSGELTLDFILDERARELYWEAHRRTDLIRFGKFSGGSYIWEWKGAVKEGRAIDAKFDIYPIPAADVTANPKLKQNTGY